MGRKSTDSTAQTKAKTKAPSSGASKPSKAAKASTSTSGETPKPLSKSSKKSRAAEPDVEEVDRPSEEPPTKKKKVTATSTTAKKPADDKPRPTTSKKDVKFKSKSVKSPLTAAKAGDISSPKHAGKKQKVISEPAEADSEESEQEWVGFGGVDDESGEEDEEEEEDGDDGSDEDELLHGLSSDDQDSSDEEVDLPGIDVSKLPTIAKDDKIVKQKLEKAKRQPVRITFTYYNSVFFRVLIFGFNVD